MDQTRTEDFEAIFNKLDQKELIAGSLIARNVCLYITHIANMSFILSIWISIACTIATPWKCETNIMKHQHEFPVILWSWGHHGSPISSEGTPNLFTNKAWNARWGSPRDVIDIGNPTSNARLCQPVPGACWQLQKFGGIHMFVSENEWKWGIIYNYNMYIYISPIYGHFRENPQI
jgi:hypothetical protein